MSVIACSEDVPGEAGQAERLWHELERWGEFVEGFASVKRVEGPWPARGSSVIWVSTPHGRGEVSETIIEHDPGVGSLSEVKDGSMTAKKHVRFLDVGQELGAPEGAVRVSVELEYRLNGSLLRHLAIDRLFVKKALGDSIRRELKRFSSELRAAR